MTAITLPEANKYFQCPDEMPMPGSLLRLLRENHQYSLNDLSRRLNLSSNRISSIERGEKPLPAEEVLQIWLESLGLSKKVITDFIVKARAYKRFQTVKLNKNDPSNIDIVRLLEYYKQDQLTNYDKSLLRLICRHPIEKIELEQ